MSVGGSNVVGQGMSARLARALESGDMAQLRVVLSTATPEERAQLEARLGAAAVESVLRNVRRSRSSDKQGRVVVINGIMGAKLDVVGDGTGDGDSVWVNYWRLLRGRIADLELDLDGRLKKRGISVRVAGLFPEYLPMVAELERRWHVLPFAFDWRLDIDLAAARLAEEVKRFSRGEPVHIVAHSMGGLVARRFTAKFPDVWRSLADDTGRGRGGRLVMLGTPNRGSFAIPLVFSGQEPIVKKLAWLDMDHDLDELLAILTTFPGCYQMLPLPDPALNDDRSKLFDAAQWGKFKVHSKYLRLGRDFQEEMRRVVDPERLVYVAGYGRETPHRVHLQGPGKFHFPLTLNGDGRVPHDTGLLDGVRTLWVDETHGDLAKNAAVLDGIHELLVGGTTDALEQARPAPRRAISSSAWSEADAVNAIPPEFVALAEKAKRGARRGAANLTPIEEARLNALLLRQATPEESAAGDAPPTTQKKPAPKPKKRVTLRVEVVWGDITRVAGDVYAVGHYNNVLPQNAEGALDRVVSAPGASEEALVLREHTRRGVLSGDVGRVAFYPWADKRSRKFVAVAGMGYLGQFGRTDLRRLARSLTLAVATMPGAKTVCTVLIGAGSGNLPLKDAVVNLLRGIGDALDELPAATSVRQLRIVEFRRRNAELILEELSAFAAREKAAKSPLAIELRPELVRDPSAREASEDVLASALASVVEAALGVGPTRQRAARRAALRKLTGKSLDLARLGQVCGALPTDKAALARKLRVEIERESNRNRNAPLEIETPTRLSCVDGGAETRVALLTRDAVVPERVIRVDRVLVDELVESMTDTEAAEAQRLGAVLGNVLLPRDFRDAVRNAQTMVVELDRRAARVHWEMLSVSPSAEDPGTPLALQGPFARQLRTTYSPAPSHDAPPSRKLRMLLVGDPGDPKAGDDLPGARREALAIYEALHEVLDIDALIGAPSVARRGELRKFAPASRLDVLARLMRGGYDVLHYCGHGDFDPKDPTSAGWLFEGGLLTARELERVDLAPRLVVANACLSGLTSNRAAAGDARDEAALLPSLADEFFHRGVRNYVGTAWEVSDEGAVLFSKKLYEALIPGLAGGGRAIGLALFEARTTLKTAEGSFDALWAAYQHYGDPTFQLAPRH